MSDLDRWTWPGAVVLAALGMGCGTAQTPEEQARWLVQAMIANRAQGVSRILWNNLVGWVDFAGDPTSIFNFMGLISNGPASGDDDVPIGDPVVAYFAYQRLIATTDADVAVLVGAQDLGVSGVAAYAFDPRPDGERFFILWSDSGAASVQLPVATDSAEVTNLVPNSQGEFSTTTQAASAGAVDVDVDADPLLVQPLAR